ncbi:MAG: T9SS type A sorting domain-containing protein, partial [Calditrichia bacterium]|nr:T9SS type A sorting domain-containing protein [Calditrichia bacterium]
RINIYNLYGQKIKELINENKPVGTFNTVWDATDKNNNKAASGIYFYEIINGREKLTKKMLLIR